MKVVRLLLLVIVALLIFISISPGWHVIGEEEEYLIPVHFLRNKEISLDLYSAGFKSAAVLTGSGIDGEEDLYPLKRLVFLLANQGVRGTVFISTGDTFRKNIAKNRHWLELFSELSSRGFELAQDGSLLSGEPGSEKEIEDGSGFRSLPLSLRLDEITENRKFLISLGRKPDGYRGYDPLGDDQIVPLLDKLGYLYLCGGASGVAKRDDLAMESGPDAGERYIYPEHTPGVQLLKYFARIDPTVDLKEARRLFSEVSRKSGVFVCQIYLPGLIDKKKLDRLRRLIIYLKKQDAWICSLRELSLWWTAREAVEIETGWDDDTLVIVYDNPTPFLLKNARLNFRELKIPARYYRVEDRRGIMASQGTIPACRWVNVTLFPTEPVS